MSMVVDTNCKVNPSYEKFVSRERRKTPVSGEQVMSSISFQLSSPSFALFPTVDQFLYALLGVSVPVMTNLTKSRLFIPPWRHSRAEVWWSLVLLEKLHGSPVKFSLCVPDGLIAQLR